MRYAGDYSWSNLLDQFNPHNRIDACEEYRRFVADARGASYNPWERLVGQICHGGEEFCEQMQALEKSKERSREHPWPQRSFARPRLDGVVEAVTKTFAVTIEDLQEKSRGDARKVLVYLAVEEAGLTIRCIAEWMKASEWGASKLRQRALERYAIDLGYRRKIDAIRQELS